MTFYPHCVKVFKAHSSFKLKLLIIFFFTTWKNFLILFFDRIDEIFYKKKWETFIIISTQHLLFIYILYHHHHLVVIIITQKKTKHEKKTQEVSDFSEREERRVMRNFENNLNANILQLKLFPFSAPLLLLLSWIDMKTMKHEEKTFGISPNWNYLRNSFNNIQEADGIKFHWYSSLFKFDSLLVVLCCAFIKVETRNKRNFHHGK